MQELVAAAAARLAGKALSYDEMHDALYQLALDLRSPARLDDHRPSRRMPAAGEVLPRHQRASWARGRTIYDAEPLC
ncbi:MAG TPA: hypothetical protein VLE97_05990 [Gaiellaceae bacterium]|nr:hypothetical protein [Gaiellaceae bacterium]